MTCTLLTTALLVVAILGSCTVRTENLHPNTGCQIDVEHAKVVSKGIPSEVVVTVRLQKGLSSSRISVNITDRNETKVMEIDKRYERMFRSEITAASLGRQHFNVCVSGCGKECKEITLYSIPGPVTLLPPVLTVAIAIFSRQVLLSLICGIYSAAFLMVGYNPVLAFIETFNTYLIVPFLDPSKSGVVVFCAILGGMIEVMEKTGGAAGVALQVVKVVKCRYHASLATLMLSFCYFFDDFAGIMISGKSLKNLVSQLGLSVQKFSFIVHMMSVLVASVCPLSSWAGIQIGYIESAFSLCGRDVSGFTYLVQSIPYRFFVLTSLFGVVIYVFINKDIEPMIKYEETTRKTASSNTLPEEGEKSEEEVPARWYNSIVPLVALIAISIVQMYFDGKSAIEETDIPVTFLNCVSHSNSITSLIIGTSASLLLALIMVLGQRILTMPKLLEYFVDGVKGMSEPIMILVLAWGLGVAMNDIHTSQYIALALGDSMKVEYFPTIVCLIGYAMSYASGSALGTQGIIFPLVIPVIVHLTDDEEVYLKTIAAACSSSVFGNLCSPIADTTIAGVLFTGCPMLDHLKVMSTFCIPVGVLSLLLGDLMVGLNLYPFWASYLVALLIILSVFALFGRSPRRDSLARKFLTMTRGTGMTRIVSSSSFESSTDEEKTRLIQDKL